MGVEHVSSMLSPFDLLMTAVMLCIVMQHVIVRKLEFVSYHS
jgi:hypothetical protein